MNKTPRADLSSFTEAELAQELARRKAEALPDGAALTDLERARRQARCHHPRS
jgi:hypothetical protein